MAERSLPQVDPLMTDAERTPVDMDMAEHVRTYNGFLNLAKWFLVHVAIMLVSLYSFLVAHNGGAGIVLMLVAIAVLIYGIAHRPAVQHDIAAATVQRHPAAAH